MLALLLAYIGYWGLLLWNGFIIRRIKVAYKEQEQAWTIELDHKAMTALVSMVRIARITGWSLPDKQVSKAGRRLWNAIERGW